MLDRFDPRDSTDRAVMADWLEDAGRADEAATVRRRWPFLLDGGRVVGIDPGDVRHVAAGMRNWLSGDAHESYPAPEVSEWAWTPEGERETEDAAGRWLMALPRPALRAALALPLLSGECLAAAMSNRLERFTAAGFAPHLADAMQAAADAMPRVRVYVDPFGRYQLDPEPA